jgi:hypothetical protein
VKIDATNMHYKDLNKKIRNAADRQITIDIAFVSVYIASGWETRNCD